MQVTGFTPQSEVRLLSGVPLTNTYTDTFDFSSKASQAAFFNGFVKATYTDFTYIRQSGQLRIPAEFDNVCMVNYVMYRNPQWFDKWFYAFVTNVEYVNPNMTALTIELDVLQTWLFDYQILPSFIEREHVANDAPFLHTIEEGLDFGPYVYEELTAFNFDDYALVIAYAPIKGSEERSGYMLDGVFTGAQYKWTPITQEGIELLNSLITLFSNAGYLDNIISIFMVPIEIVDNSGMGFSYQAQQDHYDLGTYTPRNNKLNCFPYNLIKVDNANGTINEYRFELFRNPFYFRFMIAGVFNQAACAMMVPLNYEGIEENWNQGMLIDNFPVCSWVGDTYANWLANNHYTLMAQDMRNNLGLATAVGGVLMGAATGGIGGMIAGVGGLISASQSITDTMASRKDAAHNPFQVMGSNATNNLNAKYTRDGFHAFRAHIKEEYAKNLDSYFDMFGYKVNYLGTPNTKSRTSWNYIKTIGINIKPNATTGMPQDNLNAIKAIYDNGIRFWHTASMGDYSLSNLPVNGNISPSYPNPSPVPAPPPREPQEPEPNNPYGWTYPIDGWETKITSKYGWRTDPFTGQQKFHFGMDISSPTGTQIRAIQRGFVKLVGFQDARGKYVDVEVDNTTVYRYQHCDTIEVEQGDAVQWGDNIATVGTTGNVTGPHLHVEVLINGTTTDPYPWLGHSPGYEGAVKSNGTETQEYSGGASGTNGEFPSPSPL